MASTRPVIVHAEVPQLVADTTFVPLGKAWRIKYISAWKNNQRIDHAPFRTALSTGKFPLIPNSSGVSVFFMRSWTGACAVADGSVDGILYIYGPIEISRPVFSIILVKSLT